MKDCLSPVAMKPASFLVRLLPGKDLAPLEAKQLFHKIFRGQIPESQIKSALVLLAKKGETAQEVLECLHALQSLEKPARLFIPGLMDTCGTGGDGKQSLNISTLAALVIAGAGGKVAKHGNRGISSRCGSSDLMEALGVKLDAPKSRMIESIRRFGIGYFHAPFYHPVFSKMQALRKKIKTRTIFNLLGPLANPIRVSAQLVGVSSPRTLKLYAGVLQAGQSRSSLVCHSKDGLDEISTQTSTDVAKISKGQVIWGRIEPRRLGFRASKEGIPKVRSISESRNMAIKLLQNKLKGPARDTVILNAAAGLWISGKAKGLREGIEMADHSVRSGNAYRALLGLREISRRPFAALAEGRKKRSSR